MARPTKLRSRRAVAVFFVLFGGPAGLLPAGAYRPEVAPVADAVPGQLVVKFTEGVSRTARSYQHARTGARLLRGLMLDRYDLVEVAGENVGAALRAYRSSPSIENVAPNYRVRVAISPNDPCLTGAACPAGQWNIAAVAAQLGWDQFPGRTYTAADKKAMSRIRVAVIDSPVDMGHPDFANPGSSSTDALDGGQLDIADARSWLQPGEDGPGPSSYHGTYVAGIIAAATNNATHVASIGYASEILPLAVVRSGGDSDAASLAEAIHYAHAYGSRVINLSLGMPADAQVVHDAIIGVTTAANPSLVVAAAGNNTGSNPFFPGSYPEVMSVTGFDATYARANCANSNNNVSVSAPALGVISLLPRSEGSIGGSDLCGTSASAPHVSALAALLFAQDPSRTPGRVRSIIESTAEDMGAAGKDPQFGWGEINVDKALRFGAGPAITIIKATVVGKDNWTSTITATATSSKAIIGAEAYVDRPGDPAMRVVLEPVDGSWGDTSEQLRGTVTLSSTLTGKRRLFVRAQDGSNADGWGPVHAGWVVVDTKAPVIAGLTASNVYRPIGRDSSSISFQLGDDWSPVFTYTVEARTDDGKTTVWTTGRSGVVMGFHDASWTPGADLPLGFYRVFVTATDGVGNVSAASSVQLLVL